MQSVNRKFATTLMAFAMACAVSGYAQTTGSPTVTGFMASSDEWRDLQDQAYNQYGYYSFKADGSTPFTPISGINADYNWATHGGVYADGRYYGYAAYGSWMSYTLQFRIHDASTWEQLNSVAFSYRNGQGETSKAYLVPSDLAYDAIGDEIYAAVRRYQSDQGSALCRVDRQTGELTRLGATPNLCALTADAKGELYGIAIDNGSLYHIAKDGTATMIGATGFFPSRDSELTQSATYNFADGKIYWSLCGFSTSRDRDYNDNGVYAMVVVDPATGEGNLIWNYPRDQRFSSINIVSAHPQAPDDIKDFTFSPVTAESNEAVVRFTVPAVTSAQTPLAGNVTVRCYLDGKLHSTESVRPGSKFEKNLGPLTTGLHTAAVEAEANGRTGIQAVAQTFFGVDVPAAVGNLTLKPSSDKLIATLSWDAPATGVSGSPLDPSKVRYRIVRYPGEEVVKRSYSGTEFSETVSHQYARTYYIVTPYHVDHPDNLGTGRRSNYAMMGTDIELPYSESFSTATSFDSFTTIDADGNGSDAWEAPCWKYDESYGCAFYYGNSGTSADDWLVTPPLKLDPQKLYKLSFQHYAYYGDGSHFTVAAGNEPTVDGLSRQLADIEKVTYFADMPGVTEEIVFAPREGERFIGFHHISTTKEHLSIDNISIQPIGDSRIPAAVEKIDALITDANTLTLMFDAPKLAASGKPLEGKMTIEIFRDPANPAVAKFTDVAPGARIEWTDTEAIPAENAYYVVATNDYGKGLMAETSVDLSSQLPASVAQASARYINDRQVEITWTPSEAEADGIVRYIVYRIIPQEFGSAYKIIGRDIDGTRFVDDNPFEGLASYDQTFIQYYVAPVSAKGEGVATLTTGTWIGEAYQLPFKETWSGATPATNPWLKSSSGSIWYILANAYDPMAPSYDGIGMIRCEVDGYSSEGQGVFYSPRVDLTGQKNPKLKFVMWTAPTYDSSVGLRVALDIEGVEGKPYIGTFYSCKSDKEEWKEIEIDLSAYASLNRVSAMLIGMSRSMQNIHVDNFRIEGSESAHTVAAAYITGNSDVREGSAENYIATIANRSAEAARNVKVAIKAGDVTVTTVDIASIAAGTKGIARFSFTPEAANVGTTILSATVVSAEGVTAGTVPATRELRVKGINLPAVDDLRGSTSDGAIVLNWGVPTLLDEVVEEIDGFEAYEDFAISEVGAWTMHDGDGLRPFRFNNSHGGMFEWENCTSPQAFIVFNSDAVSSSTPFKPCAGEKMAMCFGSPYGANNDWLISPELDGEEQMISFYASAAMTSNQELFNVLISRGDNKPESFIRLNGKNSIAAPESWQLYHYVLPEGTKYFAIQYVGESQDGLMIDEILFASNRRSVKPDGYNIYRNGTKLNASPVNKRSFTDSSIDVNATYSYTVRPVFGDKESRESNEVVICASSVSDAMAATVPVVTAGNGTITVTGAEGLEIAIVTPDGRLIDKAAGADLTVVSVESGIYIVKVGTVTAKVAVK